MPSMAAAAILVMASATAMRPEAGALNAASGVRSPIAMASPVTPSKPESVIATSLTGTCQGPISWSRALSPPTVRSPMCIRKPLFATAGKRSTRYTASSRVISARSIMPAPRVTRSTSRVILGGLPSNICIGMSTGWLSNSRSVTTSLPSSVSVPITDTGQRSRSQSVSNSSMRSAATIST